MMPQHRASAALIATACLLAAFPSARAQTPGPTLRVDVAADRHSISPDIYGMNDNPWDPGLGKEIQVPVSRWGGDATTRYNWEVDASNSGGDWFFMGGGGKSTVTPGGSADEFVTKSKSVGGKALLTIPVIDYLNHIPATTRDCSFPVSLVGPQQKVNPYVHPIVNGQQTDAGDGVKPDGTNIVLTRDQILRIHIPNTPAHQQAWMRHLIGKFGPAAKGGVAIYEMDNEPGGWANTHRDIHPDKPTYQEIVGKTLPYARAVKQTDPTALIDGPGDFGWSIYKGDPAKNEGLWNAEYYLKRFHDESQTAGKRLLDYFDEHYYPYHNEATRIESTRSLWDPTYVETNWIGQYNGAITLIPRMHQWVDKYYPGTKLAMTEYNWGGLNTLDGALAQADALGIFGRERLDLATLWGPPKATEPGANAFRIYRNYDGKGGRYGDVWVRSVSADQGKLAVYGAIRSQDHVVTLIVINKINGDLTSSLTLAGFHPAAHAHVFRYSAANLAAIVPAPEQAVRATGFTATYPANSITLLVIPRG